MRTVSILVVCLASSSLGRRLQVSTEHSSGDRFDAIAQLLLSLSPSLSWQVAGPRSAVVNGRTTPVSTRRDVSAAVMVEPGTPARRDAILTAAFGAAMAAAQPVLALGTFDTKKFVPRGVTIAQGVRMPVLALNTAGLSKEDTVKALQYGATAGFSHVDFHPGIERDGVAEVLKTSTRSAIFLTSKIKKADPATSASAAAAAVGDQINEDLTALGVDRFDMLLLRDHPSKDVMQAQWRAMEDALASNKTRAIGVANFCQGALSSILETAKVKPAVNYYMLHPGMGTDPSGLRSFCEKNDILTFAYGIFGEPGPQLADSKGENQNEVLKKIADSRGGTVEDVVVRWAIQNGNAVSVRPTFEFELGKSKCENNDCKDALIRRTGAFFKGLSKEDMATIDGMTSPGGNPTLFSSAGCPGPSPLRP